jgi:hypothetical protein
MLEEEHAAVETGRRSGASISLAGRWQVRRRS